MELRKKLAYFISALLALQELTEPVKCLRGSGEAPPPSSAAPQPSATFQNITDHLLYCDAFIPGGKVSQEDLYRYSCSLPGCKAATSHILSEAFWETLGYQNQAYNEDEIYRFFNDRGFKAHARLRSWFLIYLGHYGSAIFPNVVAYVWRNLSDYFNLNNLPLDEAKRLDDEYLNYCGIHNLPYKAGSYTIVDKVGKSWANTDHCGRLCRETIAQTISTLESSMHWDCKGLYGAVSSLVATQLKANPQIGVEFQSLGWELDLNDLTNLLTEFVIEALNNDEKGRQFLKILCAGVIAGARSQTTNLRPQGGYVVEDGDMGFYEKYGQYDQSFQNLLASLGDYVGRAIKLSWDSFTGHITQSVGKTLSTNAPSMKMAFKSRGWDISDDQLLKVVTGTVYAHLADKYSLHLDSLLFPRRKVNVGFWEYRGLQTHHIGREFIENYCFKNAVCSRALRDAADKIIQRGDCEDLGSLVIWAGRDVDSRELRESFRKASWGVPLQGDSEAAHLMHVLIGESALYLASIERPDEWKAKCKPRSDYYGQVSLRKGLLINDARPDLYEQYCRGGTCEAVVKGIINEFGGSLQSCSDLYAISDRVASRSLQQTGDQVLTELDHKGWTCTVAELTVFLGEMALTVANLETPALFTEQCRSLTILQGRFAGFQPSRAGLIIRNASWVLLGVDLKSIGPFMGGVEYVATHVKRNWTSCAEICHSAKQGANLVELSDMFGEIKASLAAVGLSLSNQDILSVLSECGMLYLLETERDVIVTQCRPLVALDSVLPQIRRAEGGLNITGVDWKIYQEFCWNEEPVMVAISLVAERIVEGMRGRPCDTVLDFAMSQARSHLQPQLFEVFSRKGWNITEEELVRVIAEYAVLYVAEAQPDFYKKHCSPPVTLSSMLRGFSLEGGIVMRNLNWDLFNKYCRYSLLEGTVAELAEELLELLKTDSQFSCAQLESAALEKAQRSISQETYKHFKAKGWNIPSAVLPIFIAEYAILLLTQGEGAPTTFLKNRCRPPQLIDSKLAGVDPSRDPWPPANSSVAILRQPASLDPQPPAESIVETAEQPASFQFEPQSDLDPSTAQAVSVFEENMQKQNAGVDEGWSWLAVAIGVIGAAVATMVVTWVFKNRKAISSYMGRKIKAFRGAVSEKAIRMVACMRNLVRFSYINLGKMVLPRSPWRTWRLVARDSTTVGAVLGLLKQATLTDNTAHLAILSNALPDKLAEENGLQVLPIETDGGPDGAERGAKEELGSAKQEYVEGLGSVEQRYEVGSVTVSSINTGEKLGDARQEYTAELDNAKQGYEEDYEERELGNVEEGDYGVEQVEIPVITENQLSDILETLVKPSVDDYFFAQFVKKSNLRFNKDFVDQVRDYLNAQYLVVQVRYAFLLGRLGFTGHYLRLINYHNEDVGDLFLAFIQALIYAYFPEDPDYKEHGGDHYKYQGELRDNALRAFKAYRAQKAPKNTKAEIIIMDEWIKCGKCRECHATRQYGTCEIANKTFGKLVKNDYEHIGETEGGSLLFLTKKPVNTLEKTRFLTAAAACSADTFAFAMRMYNYDGQFLRKFDAFGRCDECKLLRDYYIEMLREMKEGKRKPIPEACLSKSVEQAKGHRTTEFIPEEAIKEFERMDGTLQESFAKGWFILFAGTYVGLMAFSENLIDALNTLLEHHCNPSKGTRPIVVVSDVERSEKNASAVA